MAITVEGELVVDLWGAVDTDAAAPWERDTIVNVYSTTKTVTRWPALVLADRGELDLARPGRPLLARVRGERQGGRRVRHLLSHTAGLAGWREPITAADLCDWEKATACWRPRSLVGAGNGSGYHAVTQGYLVGEVVRRITGQTLGTFVREEIAGPLGADFPIGSPAEHDGASRI